MGLVDPAAVRTDAAGPGTAALICSLLCVRARSLRSLAGLHLGESPCPDRYPDRYAVAAGRSADPSEAPVLG